MAQRRFADLSQRIGELLGCFNDCVQTTARMTNSGPGTLKVLVLQRPTRRGLSPAQTAAGLLGDSRHGSARRLGCRLQPLPLTKASVSTVPRSCLRPIISIKRRPPDSGPWRFMSSSCWCSPRCCGTHVGYAGRLKASNALLLMAAAPMPPTPATAGPPTDHPAPHQLIVCRWNYLPVDLVAVTSLVGLVAAEIGAVITQLKRRYANPTVCRRAASRSAPEKSAWLPSKKTASHTRMRPRA